MFQDKIKNYMYNGASKQLKCVLVLYNNKFITVILHKNRYILYTNTLI